jgi:hypothetical protein
MRVRKIIIRFGAVVLFLPTIVQAQGTISGVLSRISIDTAAGNLVFLQVRGTKNDNPVCSANSSFQFVLQIGSVAGDAMFRLLRQARASGTSVSLTGTGTCDPGSRIEILKSIDY